jgi:hypothetical protein
MLDKQPARFTASTGSYMFNLHSFNDSANRILFKIASIFNDDEATCAAGACGVAAYSTLCVDEAGRIPTQSGLRSSDASGRINVWNVDTTKIVFNHSDIYKGRMATLIADLLYDENAKRSFPSIVASLPPTENRCP